jgi:hypothetical protein
VVDLLLMICKETCEQSDAEDKAKGRLTKNRYKEASAGESYPGRSVTSTEMSMPNFELPMGNFNPNFPLNSDGMFTYPTFDPDPSQDNGQLTMGGTGNFIQHANNLSPRFGQMSVNDGVSSGNTIHAMTPIHHMDPTTFYNISQPQSDRNMSLTQLICFRCLQVGPPTPPWQNFMGLSMQFRTT